MERPRIAAARRLSVCGDLIPIEAAIPRHPIDRVMPLLDEFDFDGVLGRAVVEVGIPVLPLQILHSPGLILKLIRVGDSGSVSSLRCSTPEGQEGR